MGYKKQIIYGAVAMGLLGMSVFFPISAQSAETMLPIQEAQAAIEQARQAGAEKTARDDMDQARSWLAQAEKVYADSQSILSRTMRLMVSNEARAREMHYMADMAKTKARIAEAKARKATAIAELKDATKDLADYRTSMEVLNKKLAEAAAAKEVQAKAEAERKSIEETRREVEDLEARKKKALEDTQKKLAEIEALQAKELAGAEHAEALKAAEKEKALAEKERLNLQKQKEEAERKAREAGMAEEMKAREAKMVAEMKAREEQMAGEKQRLAAMEEKMAAMEKERAAMEKEKAMLADAQKIPQAAVRASDKELVISLPTVNLFSSKNELTTSGKAILDQVGVFLGKHAADRIVIRGFTDSAGKPATNQSLSETRAQKVKEYLVVHQNILSSRITSGGFGPTQPVAGNDTEAGRALNRRVEVVIPRGQ